MSKVKEYTNGNTTLEIHTDESPSSPRTWDNLGKMICSHRNYSLGDKHDIKPSDYNSTAEVERAIRIKEDVAVMLPLYLYDHSGITMKTTPFGCNWDSGKVGYIVASKKKIREAYSVKRISKKLIAKVTELLIGEVAVYDQYLTGDVYGFKVIKDGEEIDACWGFFGSDIKTNGMLEHIDEPELVATI